jgi:ribose transport system ATP-binding protein
LSGESSKGARALEVRHVSKTFGGIRALDDVSLTIRRGEIHGLLGENGSGKSTLIKILAGYHAPDPGAELEVNGQAVKLPLETGRFRELGLSFVHQDLGLIPSLTVLENLIIGDLTTSRHSWRIPWRRERARAREIFERFDLANIDPRSLVEELSPLSRALLALVRGFEDLRTHVRGVSDDFGLLVLDEPTVFLPRLGTEQLFALIRRIVAQGASVLFVSHDLDEVREITDRVTVLRDGRVHGTVVTKETSEARLIEMIIGRQLEAFLPTPHAFGQEAPAVRIRGVTGRIVDDVSVDVRKGEIVGVTGLAGSGLEELPYLLFGGLPATAGQLEIEGREIDLHRMSPHQALAAGLVLVPADRHDDGTYMSLPIVDNVLSVRLDDYFRSLLLQRWAMLRDARQLLQEFDVRPGEPRNVYSSLSGGNQQKALLAKWLQMKPSLLILHEPTQGVDVGARAQIFRIIRAAAADGVCVICSSSDYEQLAAICDRVLVLGRGRIVHELVGADVEKDRIAERAYNSVVLSHAPHLQ